MTCMACLQESLSLIALLLLVCCLPSSREIIGLLFVQYEIFGDVNSTFSMILPLLFLYSNFIIISLFLFFVLFCFFTYYYRDRPYWTPHSIPPIFQFYHQIIFVIKDSILEWLWSFHWVIKNVQLPFCLLFTSKQQKSSFIQNFQRH